MKGRRKIAKVPGFMRMVLAVNVRLLMAHHYRESTNRPKALAKDAGVSLSTIQRILGATNGATIDNIEAVSAAFQLSAYQLLIPALDTKSPQVVRGATKDEELLYRHWKRSGMDSTGPLTQAIVDAALGLARERTADTSR